MVFGLIHYFYHKNVENAHSNENMTTKKHSTVPATSVSTSCSTSRKCEKRKHENSLAIIYILFTALFFLMFTFSFFLYSHVNNATDVTVFRDNLKSDFAKSEIRKIVKGALREYQLIEDYKQFDDER